MAPLAVLDLSLKEEEVEQWVKCVADKFNSVARSVLKYLPRYKRNLRV